MRRDSTAKVLFGLGGVRSSFLTILAKRKPQPLQSDLQLSGPRRHSIVSVAPHLWQKNASGFFALALLRGLGGASPPCISIVHKNVPGGGERGDVGHVSGEEVAVCEEVLVLRLGDISSLKAVVEKLQVEIDSNGGGGIGVFTGYTFEVVALGGDERGCIKGRLAMENSEPTKFWDGERDGERFGDGETDMGGGGPSAGTGGGMRLKFSRMVSSV